jgi:hypothetical protein
MENFNIYGEKNGDHSTEYPKSDGNGSLSHASTIQKGDHDTLVGFDGALEHHQNKIPQLDRVLTMPREYCAIGMESKIAEDGRQALEHTRAADGGLRPWREGYSGCSGDSCIIWDSRGKHDGYRRNGCPWSGGTLPTH